MSCPVELNELVKRGELYYKKLSDKPFSGKVSGQQRGKIIRGKKSGPWKQFYENGQLHISSTYKEGKLDGLYEEFSLSGNEGPKGMYRNGVREGKWLNYLCYKKVREFKLDCDSYKNMGALSRALLGITKRDISSLNCDDPFAETNLEYDPIAGIISEKEYFKYSKVYQKGDVVSSISQ